MAGDQRFSLPVAALGIIGIFVSSIFLGPRAYDLLRVGESDADKRAQLTFTQPPVEARMWEDPLAALVRHRSKLKPLCDPAAPTPPDPRCALGEVDAATLRQQLEPDAKDLTVIAAILPGTAFIGVEEARRRVRYSLLAGLASEGFFPDDSEHMGLLRVRPCGDLTPCPSPVPSALPANRPQDLKFQSITDPVPKIDIPYETLSAPPAPVKPTPSAEPVESSRRRAIVLWIDDTAVAPLWLSKLVVILGQLAPSSPGVRPPHEPGVRLRIIGPYRSDDLIRALDEDLLALVDKVKRSETGRVSRLSGDHGHTIEKMQLISPFSTAALDRLRAARELSMPTRAARPASKTTQAERPPGCKDSSGRDCIAEAFSERLSSIRDGVPTSFFVRTIGVDDRQIGHLVGELCARGLAEEAGGQVILMYEWDSIYARAFAQALEGQLRGGCPEARAPRPITLAWYPYLRGLDGANLDGASKQVRLVPRGDKGGSDARKDPNIEWPESRDQRDYVRRLVRQVKDRENGNNPDDRVRAIGLVGTDVHDKLVLAQAFRASFSDRFLFTTDLDVRLLHPDVIQYTRNLIVASSLPLQLESAEGGISPPFRDIYQTATFLAARYAAASEQGDVLDQIKVWLGSTYLYEIGRDGVVELGVDGVPKRELPLRRLYALVAGFALFALGGAMILWPSPSMRETRSRLRSRAPGFDLSVATLAALQVGAWIFALGVVIELGFPGNIGPARAWLMVGSSMLLFWAFVYPGVRNLPAGWAGVSAGGAKAIRRRRRMVRLLLLVLPLIFVWYAFAPAQGGLREPFAPASGVSSWPSQLLRTLGVVLFAWFLDLTWGRSANAAMAIGVKYFGIQPTTAPSSALPRSSRIVDSFYRAVRWLRRQSRMFRRSGRRFVRSRAQHALRGTASVLRDASIWLWQPGKAQPDGSVDGTRQWQRYCDQLHPGRRLFRTALWLGVAIALLTLESMLVGNASPEIPARGRDDRTLILNTILLHVFGTVILLVVLADVTVLTWRIVTSLKEPRTVYPDGTVRDFARKLGPDPLLQGIAIKRLPALVVNRAAANAVGRNTLLDDWIDMQRLAEHTKAIGRLIFLPFVLVALLVVARSRLLDNWAIDGAVLISLISFTLGACAMAALLNITAEYARKRALERMQEDLLWLESADSSYEKLAKKFPALIEQVKTMREGAYAPFFEQPVVQAILVPLGGAGGIKLVEALVFAQP